MTSSCRTFVESVSMDSPLVVGTSRWWLMFILECRLKDDWVRSGNFRQSIVHPPAGVVMMAWLNSHARTHCRSNHCRRWGRHLQWCWVLIVIDATNNIRVKQIFGVPRPLLSIGIHDLILGSGFHWEQLGTSKASSLRGRTTNCSTAAVVGR